MPALRHLGRGRRPARAHHSSTATDVGGGCRSGGRRVNKDAYPSDWDAIAFAIKDACGWTCLACGKECRRPDEPFDTMRRTLTVAHYDQDYSSAEIYVVALCTRCHLRLDAPFAWMYRRRYARERQKRAGQLILIEGIYANS